MPHGSIRSVATAIYYLLTDDSFSAFHCISSDEIFHFYCGDPVEMYTISPEGTLRRSVLGANLNAEMNPQIIVPAGIWQAARLSTGGTYALLGTTVSPGFDFADYQHGKRDHLLSHFPQHAAIISELCIR